MTTSRTSTRSPSPTAAATGGSEQAEVAAARLLLERLGVRPEELLNHVGPAPGGTDSPVAVPTIGEYLPRVVSAVSPGTRQAYEPYWRRIEQAWGLRRLDELDAVEIQQLAETARCAAVVRRNSRGGQSAAAHLISAARCLYQYAENDGWIAAATNPARRARKPRRLASTRRAIPETRLAEINHVVATTGNDPELDTLILRVHQETACRRGGALALRPRDLDRQQCLVLLREKGQTQRWQPVSPTLMRHLTSHAAERRHDEDSSAASPAPEHSGDPPADDDRPLLRYRDGRPITVRRYDYLWNRVGQHLPWAAAQGITAHWLRHTTLTWVERNFGYAVARAFAGHEGGLAGAGVTATYVRADLDEVAAALSALTGEPHPLAPTTASVSSGPWIAAPPTWW
ncbi:Site-specific recombinase XerD [Pseudonocardia thermophila]|uniref:Site-specific recombinase XerD n=1 Tax=Pseudonocardia thermophila TaxID=1848 RepID=A0A1M7BH58_PSETH|nr:site-specific integrase [Pseudonocardia thermophila]SHL54355.1 Site-specific recombinase XerD [Pseudonocardia thermophila]